MKCKETLRQHRRKLKTNQDKQVFFPVIGRAVFVNWSPVAWITPQIDLAYSGLKKKKKSVGNIEIIEVSSKTRDLWVLKNQRASEPFIPMGSQYLESE